MCTNTTIYKETDVQEIEILFSYLGNIGVDGLLVSPAFSFAGVDDAMFLTREEINDKFGRLTGNGHHFKFFSTPLYLSFLRGERDYECTPWANPTRNPMGWRGPLLPDRRHPLPHLRRHDAQDPVGGLRGGPGLPLRPVHDAFRVRTHGGARDGRPEGYLDHAPVESHLRVRSSPAG